VGLLICLIKKKLLKNLVSVFFLFFFLDIINSIEQINQSKANKINWPPGIISEACEGRLFHAQYQGLQKSLLLQLRYKVESTSSPPPAQD